MGWVGCVLYGFGGWDNVLFFVVVFVMLIVFNKLFNVLCQFIDCSQLLCVMLVGFGLLLDVYVVGCLDYDSEGFLLFIDDGGLVYVFIDLCYKVDKIYWVQVEGIVIDVQLQVLCVGVQFNDGFILLVGVECLELLLLLWFCILLVWFCKMVFDVWLVIILCEGWNCQVWWMIVVVGLFMLWLVWVVMGVYVLDGL